MKNSLKTGLLIAGIVLIGFGLYTVFSTSVDAGPLQESAKDYTIETESIVLMVMGGVALIASIFYRKK